MAPSGLLAHHQRRVARVVAYVEDHLDAGPAPVAALAEIAGLSEFHFHRVFRAVIGESVMAHARRLRLERAARRLRGAEGRPIGDLALEAGFESHEGFTRAFVALFGVAPSKYRTQCAASPACAPAPASFARVEHRAPARALALRHVGPYGEVGATWGALYAASGATGPALGLCHDDPEVTDPARFRYDACLITPAAPRGALRSLALPGGRFVVAVHRGPYATLATSYANLLRWALERDLPIAPAASHERYLDAPGSVGEDQLRTEIALPIDDGGSAWHRDEGP